METANDDEWSFIKCKTFLIVGNTVPNGLDNCQTPACPFLGIRYALPGFVTASKKSKLGEKKHVGALFLYIFFQEIKYFNSIEDHLQFKILPNNDDPSKNWLGLEDLVHCKLNWKLR